MLYNYTPTKKHQEGLKPVADQLRKDLRKDPIGNYILELLNLVLHSMCSMNLMVNCSYKLVGLSLILYMLQIMPNFLWINLS